MNKLKRIAPLVGQYIKLWLRVTWSRIVLMAAEAWLGVLSVIHCAIYGYPPIDEPCRHPLTGEDCSYDEMVEAEIERLCEKDD